MANKFKMANKSTMGSEKKRFSSIPVAKKEKHGKNDAEEDTFDLFTREDKPCGIYYIISLFTLAFGFGCLHIYHVSTLFENDRHFSHLSMMEREMTFRTEMGLYYSYYKRIIEAPSFIEGLEQITNDNLTEYPKVINTLQRFNLCPEVLIGLLFRTYLYIMDLLDLPTKQCWQIERGQNLPPVTSCEGLGDPIYFYIEMVWICAGFTMGLVFIYGLVISRSIIGGSLSVICFFYNHSECTRIQWTPPLRESFAYPFILLQLLCVTYFLRRSSNTIPWIVQMSVISISSWVCLLLWQFSQFVIASQVIAVFVMFLLKIIKKDLLTLILMSQMLGVLQATVSLYGNKLIVCSLLTSMLSSILLILMLVEPLVEQCNSAVRGVTLASLVAGGTLLTKQFLNFLFNNKDDDHILNILRSKLTGFKDFHSLLYTCSVEFDFMKTDILKKLSMTLLIPSVLFVLTFVVFHWGRVYYRNIKKTTEKQKKKGERERWVAVVEPDVVYNMLQLFAFTIMAIFIMRLKLFFTPQLCILAALLATRKYFRFFKTVEIHWAILAVMLGGMSIQGIENLQDQRSILGEYSDVPLEELLTWVNTETKPNAVFAGPMPTMANLLLSTRRPIVNHPHYEDAELRERTKKVYSIFSRKSPQDVFLTLLGMKVEYVILDESWCFRESKKGCSMVDLWDVEEPFNKHRPPLCPQLFIKTPPPFHRVFANENYVVLRLLSQYVEIKPSQEFKF